jgi:hypothetical protein
VDVGASIRLGFGAGHQLAIVVTTDPRPSSAPDEDAPDAEAFGVLMAWCGGVLDTLRRPLDAVTWRAVVGRLVSAPDAPAELAAMAGFHTWEFAFDTVVPSVFGPALLLSAHGHLPGIDDLHGRSADWTFGAGADGGALADRPAPPTVDECVLVGAVASLATVHRHLGPGAAVPDLARLVGVFLVQTGQDAWRRFTDDDVSEIALTLTARHLFGFDPLAPA